MASFYKYYYYIDFRLMDNDENNVYSFNDYVSAVRITKDYNNHVFPIFEINTSITKPIYNIILNHNVSMKIDFIKRTINSDSGDSFEINSNYEDTYIFKNYSFEFIDKDNLQYSIESISDNSRPMIDMNFTLFYEEHLKINKVNFNYNFLNVNMLKTLTVMNNINQNSIYIERPDNLEIFEQVLIPPMNAPKLPIYLQSVYGVYKDGIREFFDYNNYYIINNLISNKTPINTGSYKNVILDIIGMEEINRVANGNYGYKSEESNYYYIKADSQSIILNGNKRTTEEIFGSKKIVFNRDNNLNANSSIYEKEEVIKDKVKVFSNDLSSPFINDVLLDKKHSKTLFMYFSYLDINTFDCNKRFRCKINGENYEFKVDNVIFELIKESGSSAYYLRGKANMSENI